MDNSPGDRTLDHVSFELKLAEIEAERDYYRLIAAQTGRNSLSNIQDLTKIIKNLRQTEEALRMSQHELETRVAKRTADLISLNAELHNEISEHRQTEEMLRVSRLKYQTLLENTSDWVWEVDENARYTYVNSRIHDLLGYTPEEVIGKCPFDLMPDDEIKRVAEIFSCFATQHKPFTSIENKNQHKDGHHIVLETSGVPFFDDNGTFRGYRGIDRDITERKLAEEALRESEGKYRLIVENAFEAILVAQDDTLKFVNPRGLQMSGYTLEELLSKPFIEFVHPDDRAMVLERQQKRMRREIGPAESYSFRIIRKDGGIRRVEMKGALTTWENRPASVNFLSDITEHKRAEEELLKTQKLESLGILAGGIAHDFNNLLTAILGNISLVRMKLETEDPLAKLLAEAEKASFHAKDLTQQLLTFARGGTPIKTTVIVEQLIRDSAAFALRGSNVKYSFSCPEKLWPLELDEGQVMQVFNNILINACQAMPGGGGIRIAAENVDIVAKNSLPLAEGKYVRISIEDQGIGIPEENLRKIFDPYFTTKQKGSGLGLAITNSIIRNHDGHITASSKLGAGTTFIIYLPASSKRGAEKEQDGKEYMVGSGRVLVMDDEEMVRKVAGEMLRGVGYEVEFAPDGAEAVRIYKAAMESSRPFDVVIMDLTVPGGTGGKEAIKLLRELDPNVRAIVSSGYSNDPVMSDFKGYGFVNVIAKPYRISDLSKALNDILKG